MRTRTRIVVPDSLVCTYCGEEGSPIEAGGCFHFVGIMNRPTDGSPCFPGTVYGICPDCVNFAFFEMDDLLSPWQRIRIALSQWWQPQPPLACIWFALTGEQRAAWVRAVESLRTMGDLTAGMRER